VSSLLRGRFWSDLCKFPVDEGKSGLPITINTQEDFIPNGNEWGWMRIKITKKVITVTSKNAGKIKKIWGKPDP
jgi:hypothetical protein